jgi:glucosamine 6-phosphate synthetase-like amidotransferase/phosphosugar isomerase protein
LLELLAERYPDQKTNEITSGNTTDTAVLTALLAGDLDHTLEATALELLPKVKGAFCLVFMDESTLYAARDPQGVRPLVLGRLERGWVVASETAALDIVGASFVREIEPGELIAIDENGLRSSRFAEVKRAGCVFEYVYLARPDTTINGKNVYEVFRQETLAADDRALMLKLQDVVRAASSQASFGMLVERMREATQGPTVVKPVAAVEILAKTVGLLEAEKNSVLENLIRGQDYSRWGALNAVTAIANEHPSYDRATELETIGGRILALAPTEWTRIAEAA